MTDNGRLIRPHPRVVTAGAPSGACGGRRCAGGEPRKSLAAGLADLGAAAGVLIVGGDVADAGVQPDGVVVGADHLQFGAQLVGVADVFQMGPLALDAAEEALDRGLVGRGVRPAEVLDDRAQRQELAGRPGGHLGAVVGDRQQQRAAGVVLGQVHPAVLASSVRVMPMCEQVRQAIGRQLPAGARPDDLVFPGPGGSNGIPRGARTPLSTHNLRRVYQAAVAAAGDDLAHLELHGPHDLRHTFATWLEDAGIASRVIDELMGHAGGRRSQGGGGSPMGRVYRETTPAMLTRVVAALDDRIDRAAEIAASSSGVSHR
jgi:hypothetical protein